MFYWLHKKVHNTTFCFPFLQLNNLTVYTKSSWQYLCIFTMLVKSTQLFKYSIECDANKVLIVYISTPRQYYLTIKFLNGLRQHWNDFKTIFCLLPAYIHDFISISIISRFLFTAYTYVIMLKNKSLHDKKLFFLYVRFTVNAMT